MGRPRCNGDGGAACAWEGRNRERTIEIGSEIGRKAGRQIDTWMDRIGRGAVAGAPIENRLLLLHVPLDAALLRLLLRVRVRACYRKYKREIQREREKERERERQRERELKKEQERERVATCVPSEMQPLLPLFR